MSQEIMLFESAIRKVNLILKLIGLQLISENNDKRFLARLRQRWFFCLAFIWYKFDFAAEVAWLVDGVMSGKTMVELTYPASCLAMCLLGDVKGYYFLKYEPTVNDLIKTMRMLQTITASGKVKALVEKELKTRMSFLVKVTNAQCCLTLIALSGFAILPFIMMGWTYYQTGEIELVMPYVVLYPFNVYDIRIWPFMYLRQMWSAQITVFMVLGPDSLYYACCAYIQIQFRYLHYDLERIISGKLSEQSIEHFRTEFSVCMQRHKQLIRCVSLIEQIYSKSTLFNVVMSSMIICLTGFNVTAIPSWPLMMPFVGFVFLASSQIFLFCYFGDIIMESSVAISDAVFNCQWYNTDEKIKRDLLFVLIRAQKPCKLTAYGFSNIHLRTFTRILSTASSYFALLSTVNRSHTSE